MYNTVRQLLNRSHYSIVESFEIEGRSATFSEIPSFLRQSKAGAYLDRWTRKLRDGNSGLWSHQSKALNFFGQGKDVAISTGTASGKSLVFQVAAMHKLLIDQSARIVVFCPLRALVTDQLHGWRTIAREFHFDETTIGQIDGSVDRKSRDQILKHARVIVMTPDVCHAWLMAQMSTPTVKEFLKSLQLIIIDEAHTFEGVFGSNFAFLMRRLIAARNFLIGDISTSTPLQFIAATATISNPKDHLNNLTGNKFEVIDHNSDGAPLHKRFVAHVAYPGGPDSIVTFVADLQKRILEQETAGGFITFIDSRKGVERLALASQPDMDELSLHPLVVPYRSGFTVDQRREIEIRLQKGKLKGVISTSALELGVNLPHLQVGFNVGIPATRKSYIQRLGRVGRNSPGAFIVIAPHDAFRSYGTTLAEYHQMSVEPSHLYLDNRFVQFAHGRCLSDELDALVAPSSLPRRVQWPKGLQRNL